VVVKKEENSD
jgi:hypothetical protein